MDYELALLYHLPFGAPDGRVELGTTKTKPSTEAYGDDDDDDNSKGSFSGDSFGGDDSGNELSMDGSNSQLRELRLLRERRILRQTQKTDRVTLRYHFFGVVLGFSLVVISFLLIVFIARAVFLSYFFAVFKDNIIVLFQFLQFGLKVFQRNIGFATIFVAFFFKFSKLYLVGI